MEVFFIAATHGLFANSQMSQKYLACIDRLIRERPQNVPEKLWSKCTYQSKRKEHYWNGIIRKISKIRITGAKDIS
ncbi:MAG: hypothetical protein JRN52_15015 [Nitrososphaerota archaeon]|nr:hypothetical protein [Nitrososphaerota archaeon]